MRSVVRVAAYVVLAVFIGGAIYAAYWATSVPWYAWRMAAVNSYSVAPAASIRLELRAALQRNDFKSALTALERQKQVAELMGFTNFMKHDLVRTTALAVRHAYLINEEAQFAPWLAELNKIVPRDYRLLPMRALAVARTDPAEAEKFAMEAIAVLPIDELPYRGLLSARLAQDQASLREVCETYRTAQLGSFHTWYYQSIGAIGQDARTLFVSVDTAEHGRLYSVSQGIELGKDLTSEFNVDQTASSNRFSVIMPTIPGIKLTIHSVQIESPTETMNFMPRDLIITPASGYVVSVNEVILTANQGENITFQTKSGMFPPYSRIKLSYRLEKLPLSNLPECLEGVGR